MVQAITEGIRDGLYAPGQRLVEADLTREFGISRGPLREAFGRLAADGLVVIEPYRGALVRRMSREDIIELFQVREALEGKAARLAAERIDTVDHRTRLEGVLAEVRGHREGSDVGRYMDVNERFHQVIVEISGNKMLARLLGQLHVQAFRLLYRRLADAAAKTDSIDEHDGVAAAILASDPDGAERAMREHVRSSAESVLRLEVWQARGPLGGRRAAH
ncbi:GntR family transcriptional regulator [Pseudonocardia asaccharolytica]|uniref:GntR family transcriptional regulator n=1 Tax=Pseudonocardia asaccharolytica TaxID=54010 RepID=UPI000424A577|nr:GntR family transcriptional regulator [Pseudonocardia asaccharolytica]